MKPGPFMPPDPEAFREQANRRAGFTSAAVLTLYSPAARVPKEDRLAMAPKDRG